ncbi:MAG: T9SS type A sorting domain-containing protein [Ignavibacteriae bacterium]|nr:T9SS type A sorting domain-containing protein [Ignavibacteriota bacterium]
MKLRFQAFYSRQCLSTIIVFFFNYSVVMGQCFTYVEAPNSERLFSVSFADSLHGIIVGGAGLTTILYTKNGGLSWNKGSFRDINNHAFFAVKMLDTNTAIATGHSGIIAKTTDGGITWTKKQDIIYINYGFNSLSFVDSQNGITAGAGTFIKTTDAGEHWEQVSSVPKNIFDVVCLDSSTVVAASDQGIILSTDKGSSWQDIPSSGGYITSLSFIDRYNGWAGGPGVILKTTDGGITWNWISSFNQSYIISISFFDQFHGIATDYFSSIQITSNGGISWTDFELQQFHLYDVCYITSEKVLGVGVLSSNGFAGGIISVDPFNICLKSTIVPFYPPENAQSITLLQDPIIPYSVQFDWKYSRHPNVHSIGSRFQISIDSTFLYSTILDTSIDFNGSPYNKSLAVSKLDKRSSYFWRMSFISDDDSVLEWFGPWKFSTAGGDIKGRVYKDLNKNSSYNSGEPGVFKRLIKLNGKTQGTIYTDSLGVFSFIGLDSGIYKIIYKPTSPWKSTAPSDTYSVFLPLNDSIIDINFGQYMSIWNKASGIVYHDANENGNQDSAEPGLNNWTVRLKRNSSESFVTTDTLGTYLFDYLEIESCSLFLIPQSRWEKITPRLVDAYTIQFNSFDRHISTLHFGVHPIPQRVKLAFTFHDTSYNRIQTIQFGVRPNATFGLWNADINATRADFSEGEDEIPPPIPDAFDVRFVSPRGTRLQFGNGSWVDMRPYFSSAQQDTYKIIFQTGYLTGGSYPVTFRWDKNQIDSAYSGQVFFRDMYNVDYDLKSLDSLVISDNTIQHLMLFASSPILPPLSVWSDDEIHPAAFQLEQNYPNPFNPTTNFEFRIAGFGLVTLKIFNLLGQQVSTVLDREALEAGDYEYEFNATNLPSGIYLYQLAVEPKDKSVPLFIQTKKMVYLR